jgi:hypothetical protein
MMNKQIALLCLALASATVSAQQAPAATTTTEKFVTMCANTADAAAQNFCHGYSQGGQSHRFCSQGCQQHRD